MDHTRLDETVPVGSDLVRVRYFLVEVGSVTEVGASDAPSSTTVPS